MTAAIPAPAPDLSGKTDAEALVFLERWLWENALSFPKGLSRVDTTALWRSLYLRNQSYKAEPQQALPL